MSETLHPRPQATTKYTPEKLLPALRLFIEARNSALKSDFTDNGGAIHSVERILDILCQRICYPHLRHISSLKKDKAAEISIAAHEARERGEPIEIEHVRPQRAYACQIIELVGQGISDEDLIEFIRSTYRLVLVTKAERRALDKKNRSKIAEERLEGIDFRKRSG